MNLNRRQAVATVLAGGFGAGTVLQSLSPAGRSTQSPETGDISADELQTLVALGEVLYPPSVSTTEELVAGYLQSQPEARRRGIRDAISAVNQEARQRWGEPFAALDSMAREQVLREMGVDRAAPVPAGMASEQVRHYLVNGLLFALFTNQAGGQLVGIENPRGYPGGYESYAAQPAENRK